MIIAILKGLEIARLTPCEPCSNLWFGQHRVFGRALRFSLDGFMQDIKELHPGVEFIWID